MAIRLNVLLLDDTESDALLVLRELRRGGYDVAYQIVDNADDMRAALKRQRWDAILSDYSMPSFNAVDALKIMQDLQLDLPFIIVSGTVGEDTAVTAMKAGASDFFAKGKLVRLVPSLERELREAAKRRELVAADARFATAFHSNLIGMLITRFDDGTVLDANAHFLSSYGLARDELVGHAGTSVLNWLEPESEEHIGALLLETGSVQELEVDYAIPSGRQGTVRIWAELIELNRERCVLIMTQDITESKRAELALRAYADRLALLHDVDLAILLAEHPQSIAETVLRHLEESNGFDSASVAAFNLEDREFTKLASIAPIAGYDPYADPSIIERLKRNEPHYVEDLLAVDSRTASDEALLAAGLRCTVQIPLMAGEKLLGSFNLRSTQPGGISGETIRLAKEVGAQMAIAIEKTELLEIERRRTEELTGIHEASLQLTQSLNVDDVLELILSYAIRLMNANNAHVFLYNGELLTFGAAKWHGKQLDRPFAEPRQDGLTYMVARSGVRLVIPVVNEHPIYKDWQWGGAIIALPLRIEHTVVGVMSISYTAPHRFNEHEVRILELLADQAAIAIHNAQLYQQISGHAAELERRVVERTAELQASEANLRAALAYEKELNTMKTNFTSIVSHEFRTPLSVILSTTELLKSYYDRIDAARRLEKFATIIGQVKRLVGLLDDVLMITRSESGSGFEFKPVAIDLVALCESILEEVRISYRTDVKIEFTAVNTSRQLLADEFLFRHILQNLATNAVKYSNAGGVVQVSIGWPDETVTLKVRDDGIGIPESDQKQLFETFHRATNVGQTQGSGIGLTIVKRAVDACGGSITFDSVEGQGTTFVVQLPFVPES